MATEARVWFHGEGPDNALDFEGRAYLAWLFGRGAWRQFGLATAEYIQGRSAREWAAFLKKCAKRRHDVEASPELLRWLDRDLVRSLHLAERLRDVGKINRPVHPWHPQAIASFNSPIWSSFLGGFDPKGSATAPLDWRHPY